MKTKNLCLLLTLALTALLLSACGSGGAEVPLPASDSQESASSLPFYADEIIDIDLSSLSGTVVYSQVYDMLTQPDAYLGKVIRMRGAFSYFQDDVTKQEYFSTIIADATACCAQGIEFVWAGEHTYPDDYPEIGADITVTGVFDTYLENGYRYARLIDAIVA